MIETEDYAMSLIRNRRNFLSALFSALLALALFVHGTATAQEVKQIKLTEKHIQGFMAAYEDMAKLYESANPEPDPKVEAQAEAVAKRNGFASLDEYDDVSFNISMIMSGIARRSPGHRRPASDLHVPPAQRHEDRQPQ